MARCRGLHAREPWSDDRPIALKFIEGLALAVGPRPTRNVSDEQARIRIALDDEVVASQATLGPPDTPAAAACSSHGLPNGTRFSREPRR